MSSTHVSLWSTPRNLLKKQKSFMMERPTTTPELMIGKTTTINHRRVLQKQISVDQMQSTRSSWNNNNAPSSPNNVTTLQQPRTNNLHQHQETSGLKIVANNMNNINNNNNHRNKRHHLLNQPLQTTAKNE